MKIAAITQVYNESFFLPIWLNHYGNLFGYENLFVIDDGSTDGSTSDKRIKNLITKRRTKLDEQERSALIGAFHESMLQYYEIVIYTDCDELILLDPSLGMTLQQYLKMRDNDFHSLIGFDVLHDKINEPRLSLNIDLFQQRNFVRFNFFYCKTLISRVPIRWTPGFHECDKIFSPDGNLFLFHLRSADYENSRNRIKTLNSIQFTSRDLEKNHSYQFRMNTASYLQLLYDEANKEIANPYCGELKELFFDVTEKKAEISHTVKVPARFRRSIQLSIFAPPKTTIFSLENLFFVSKCLQKKPYFQREFDNCAKTIFS